MCIPAEDLCCFKTRFQHTAPCSCAHMWSQVSGWKVRSSTSKVPVMHVHWNRDFTCTPHSQEASAGNPFASQGSLNIHSKRGELQGRVIMEHKWTHHHYHNCINAFRSLCVSSPITDLWWWRRGPLVFTVLAAPPLSSKPHRAAWAHLRSDFLLISCLKTRIILSYRSVAHWLMQLPWWTFRRSINNNQDDQD